MMKLTARRLLPGLGVAGWLLAGIPACTREVAVEPDRVPAEQGDADARTREAAVEADRIPAEREDADPNTREVATESDRRAGDAGARRAVATEADRILAEQGDAEV